MDGGSGHAGRSAPNIHLGLGATPQDQSLEVKLEWRDAKRKSRRSQIVKRYTRLAYRRIGFAHTGVESKMSTATATDSPERHVDFLSEAKAGYRIYALWHFMSFMMLWHVVGQAYLGFEQAWAHPMLTIGTACLTQFFLEWVDAKGEQAHAALCRRHLRIS